MRTSCIRLRAKSRIAVLYEDFLELLNGNMLAAMLLAILVYWTDVKIGKKDSNLWIWKSHADFQDDLMFDKPGMKPPHRTTIKSALDLLIEKKYIERRKNPKMPLDQTKQYVVNQSVLQAAIDALPPIVGITTMESRENDNAESNNQHSMSENRHSNVEKPTSNTNDYGTEITESVITNKEGESAQQLRDGSATHDGTETPPADNVSDFLSESAKLRALKVASVPHPQTAHEELPVDVEDWDTSGLDSTQEMRAVKIGGQDAAVHAGNDHGTGAGGSLPGHTDAGRVPAHPGAAAPVAAAHAAHRDTRGDRLAVPAATPAAAEEPPDTSLDACSGPLFAGQDGAAPPTAGTLSPVASSQPRASGASIPPLSVRGDAPPLTRKQQDKLIAHTFAAYWAVIEAWKGQKYSQAQRGQACHTSGLEAMYADGVTPDALTDKLKLLDDFQKRTFNVNRLYLEWWNNLDEAQPAKPVSNGRAGKSRTAYDGQTDLDTYGFGHNDEAQIAKFTKLGAAS